MRGFPFAWYTASNLSKEGGTASTSNLSVKSNGASLGKFTFEPVMESFATAVDLTDDEGKTYYYVGDPTVEANKHEGTVGLGYSEGTVKLKITYSKAQGGDDLTDEQIKAAFLTLNVTSVTVKVYATGQAKIADASNGVYAAHGDHADYANALSREFTITANSMAFSGGVWTSAAHATTVVYGIEGTDGTIADATSITGVVIGEVKVADITVGS